MSCDKVFAVMDGMVTQSALDANVISLLAKNFDEINAIRIAAQGVTVGEYHDLQHQLVGYA